MAPKGSAKSIHLPVFAGVEAILVSGHYGFVKVSWPILQKRFSELHGSESIELSPQTTHIVAGTWLSVMKRFSWTTINSAITHHGLKVVDVSWLIDSIKARKVQDCERYEIFESEEATRDAWYEQDKWEAEQEERKFAYAQFGPVVSVGVPFRRQDTTKHVDCSQTKNIMNGVRVVFVEEGITDSTLIVYKSKIVDLGGVVHDCLTENTTHVITMSYPKACRKFGKQDMRSAVMIRNVFVVSPDWLLHSAAGGKQEHPMDFDLFEAWPRKGQNPYSEEYVTTSEEEILSEEDTANL